jgi:hypothetical protein
MGAERPTTESPPPVTYGHGYALASTPSCAATATPPPSLASDSLSEAPASNPGRERPMHTPPRQGPGQRSPPAGLSRRHRRFAPQPCSLRSQSSPAGSLQRRCKQPTAVRFAHNSPRSGLRLRLSPEATHPRKAMELPTHLPENAAMPNRIQHCLHDHQHPC